MLADRVFVSGNACARQLVTCAKAESATSEGGSIRSLSGCDAKRARTRSVLHGRAGRRGRSVSDRLSGGVTDLIMPDLILSGAPPSCGQAQHAIPARDQNGATGRDE